MDWLESLGTHCKDNVDINYLELRTIFPTVLCFAETLAVNSCQRVSS